MDLLFNDPMEYFDERAPERIVSLVPSWTSTLKDLGQSKVIVGVTDYCPQSEERILTVGGPKSIDVEKIFNLKPDLVIANQEENTREAIHAICSAGIPVWLTFPMNVKDLLMDLWKTCRLFRSDYAMDRVRLLEKSVEWMEQSVNDLESFRYFCPIWQDRLETGEPWWMTFNQNTYSSDVLRLLGGHNCFAGRDRKYPLLAELGYSVPEAVGQRDTRYPRVGIQEIINSSPDVILFLDEPYSFSKKDIQNMLDVLCDIPAVVKGQIFQIDGRYLHWPGTILAKTLDELPGLFQANMKSG